MASSHQAGGLPCAPPFWTAAYSAVPAGMPRRSPASAGSSCAADSPATVCRGVAPRERVIAEKRRASSTVAQVVKIVLAAARMTITTVMTSSTSLTRPCPGSGGPENGPDRLESRLTVAW